eukprot:10669411-Lingulodinium_polyedra.AAC.1
MPPSLTHSTTTGSPSKRAEVREWRLASAAGRSAGAHVLAGRASAPSRRTRASSRHRRAGLRQAATAWPVLRQAMALLRHAVMAIFRQRLL